ncbi:SRPBCC domain-containing protein [Paenibacillus sp. GCM10023252]|uniref:SRPBCC domain-containing protein n=1 Tax=Paenibacillus sp. GCM10023252 TaxID=3252649 RepID=UPI00360D7CCA
MLADLNYQLYIGASPREVWDILILPDGVRKTTFGCEIRSTFEIGSSIEYVGPGQDGAETVHIYGEVQAFEPEVRFSYTEHPGPSYRDNHAELQTRVTIRLEPVGACTKLTLIQDQWEDHNPSYANAGEGWSVILSSVKTLAETGKTLDLGW